MHGETMKYVHVIQIYTDRLY